MYWMPVSQESVNTLHSTIMEGLAAREFLCTSKIYSAHNVYYELTASYYTHTVSASILVLLMRDKILISMILFTVYTMLTVQLEVRGCYASSLRYFINVFSYAGSATTGLAKHSITPSFSSAQSNLLTDIRGRRSACPSPPVSHLKFNLLYIHVHVHHVLVVFGYTTYIYMHVPVTVYVLLVRIAFHS